MIDSSRYASDRAKMGHTIGSGIYDKTAEIVLGLGNGPIGDFAMRCLLKL